MRILSTGEMYTYGKSEDVGKVIKDTMICFKEKHGYLPDCVKVRAGIEIDDRFPIPVHGRSDIPPRHFIFPIATVEREPVIAPERSPVV